MKKSLTKSAIYNVIYQGLNVVFPLISATYVAKILSPGGVGYVAYAQNIVSYFVMIAMLGMPTYGTREIAKCGNDQEQLNKLFSELIMINTISTALCMVVYGIGVVGFIKESRILFLICGLELLFNFINVDWFYRGREDFVYIAIRSLMVKIISLLFLFALVRDREDCAVYAAIVCIANGSNYVFNMVRLRKEVKLIIHGLNLKKHMKPLLSLLICSIAASLYSKIDVTMLGRMCSNVSVGLYSTAFKTIGIAIGVVTSATSVFLPRISYCYDVDRKKFVEYVTRGLQTVVFIAVPAVIGIALVSSELMTVLFGEAYTDAYSVIIILSPLLIVKGVGDIMCYQVLVSTGKENRFLISYIAAAIANIVMNSVLIPYMDYNGAALASVISELIVNVSLLRYAIQEVWPKLGSRFLISIAISTLGMICVVQLVYHLIADAFWRLLSAVATGCFIYLGMNLVMKNDVMQIVTRKLRIRQN